MKIVAEGTETIEQVNLVKLLGCEMAQGYFYSRPVSGIAITALLQSATRKFATVGA
jgi:EAL domain-containing protein (putative c-di-GMP-specific phosphodiesterase class I)